jgi:hypothetical protein
MIVVKLELSGSARTSKAPVLGLYEPRVEDILVTHDPHNFVLISSSHRYKTKESWVRYKLLLSFQYLGEHLYSSRHAWKLRYH